MNAEQQRIAIAEACGWRCRFTETTVEPVTCYAVDENIKIVNDLYEQWEREANLRGEAWTWEETL